MSCVNDPGYEHQATGTCHICQQEALVVHFCPLCCHWFCHTCNTKVVARIVGALKEYFGGPVAGCCGPTGREQW